MYSLMRQPHRPTAVEHCVSCKFITESEENLVVAGSTQLQVFAIREIGGQQDRSQSSHLKSSSSSNSARLELVLQTSVHGVVAELHAVRVGRGGRDALLIAFDDGKVSLVEYDSACHDFYTLAILNAEQEEYQGGIHRPTLRPILRVDPEQRCAVLLVYDQYLLVCPFRKDEPASSRSSVLAHYAVALHSLDSKLHNVIDLQFLHGYYEPTIFMLYEPTRTCPGRIAVRQDSVSLLAVSLSLSERVHPSIWSFDGLPADCFKVLPVPKPIGGVVVFAVNSLLYLNQSVPPYGVSLNSIVDQTSAFPLRQQADVTLSLDCCQACFIRHDRFVVSLRTGEIYVVGLKADNMRMVRGFKFDKAAASVLTCCMCTVADKYLLLGSRLGNPLLLHYSQKAGAHQGEEPASKRRSTTSDWLASGLDEDELEVYGSTIDSESTDLPYVFEVCDSLLNVGPLSSTSLGEPSNIANEYVRLDHHELELVSCSGYGKNGCLAVMQQTLLPQLITTFELQGCTDMWTVFSGKSDVWSGGRHAYLILALEDRTMILQTGSEIQELDESGFDTASPTVFAGNIGESNWILQVCKQGVRLLEGVSEVEYLPLVASTEFVRCSVVSPYAVLLCADGTMYTLILTESDAQPQMHMDVTPLVDVSPISCCCLYKDVGGMFNMDSDISGPATSDLQRRQSTSMPSIKKEVVLGVDTGFGMTAEEEDELLYGGADEPVRKPEPVAPVSSEGDSGSAGNDADDMPFFGGSSASRTHDPAESGDAEHREDTYWCVICRRSGLLEIFMFPEMVPVFCVGGFANVPRLLVDRCGSADGPGLSDQSDASPIREVVVAGLGPSRGKPYLLACTAQDVQIYQAFQYPSEQPGERLNVRFTKVKHSIVLRDQKSTSLPGTENSDEGDSKELDVPVLRSFHNVGSHCGVFLCGPSPHWILLSQHGALRCQPMVVDGPVACFAPFDNINCPQGFLYFNAKANLRIAVLPRHLSLDSDWPVRKVPLRRTPHFVSYHPELKVYGVVTSKSEPRTVQPHTTNDEESELPKLEEDDRFIYPDVRKYTFELYSPSTWEPIPNVSIEFDEFESVLSMQALRLNSTAAMTTYFVLCTCMDQGEEVTARSRVIILETAELVAAPNEPSTYKFKALYDKEMKGPVSAIGYIRGHFAAALGQKVYVWSFANSKDLVGVAFVDAQLFIHTMSTLGDFLLVGDIRKSIALLKFDTKTRSLSIVSRDTQFLEVVSSNYLVEQKKLGFVVSDMMNNLIVFSYQPEALESEGGHTLLRRADVHVGTRINSIWRTTVLPVSMHGVPSLVVKEDRRQLTWFSGMDGSIGYMIPVGEKTYRRLLRLQDKLITFLPHFAGLHPKAFRTIRTAQPALVNPHRNVLDGDLLLNFIYASKSDQRELARSLGTTADTILSDLVDVTYSSCVY